MRPNEDGARPDERADAPSHETPSPGASDTGVVQPTTGSQPPVRKGRQPPLPQAAPSQAAREPQVVYGYPVGPAGIYQPSAFAAWWNRRSTVYLVLVVILALIVATLALAVHALLRDVPPPQVIVQASPTPSAPRESSSAPPAAPSTTTPEPAPATTPAPEAAEQTVPEVSALPPVPPGTLGETFTSGVATLMAGDVYDFDENSDFLFGNGTDIAVTGHGMTGLNAVPLSVYGTEDVPTMADCAAVPPEDWVLTVSPAQLVPGTHICYVTNDGRRYGYLTVQDVEFNTDGELDEIEIAYLVWRGASDLGVPSG